MSYDENKPTFIMLEELLDSYICEEFGRSHECCRCGDDEAKTCSE